MNEQQFNAIIREIEQQRSWALTRCASMAVEISSLMEKLSKLEEKKDE